MKMTYHKKSNNFVVYQMAPRVHLKIYSPSYVLKAMEIPEEEIECSVRISWGSDTSENELKEKFG